MFAKSDGYIGPTPPCVEVMPSPLTSTPEIIAAVIFAIAVLHTFSTKFFAHLAHIQPRHAGLWHLLAEVEVVFGFWAPINKCSIIFWFQWSLRFD